MKLKITASIGSSITTIYLFSLLFLIAEPEQGTAQIQTPSSQNRFRINNFQDQSIKYIGDRNDHNNNAHYQNSEMKIIDPRLNELNLKRIAQEREMWRRNFQPTLWERVKDILNPLNPFA